jgi:hypothetical protein
VPSLFLMIQERWLLGKTSTKAASLETKHFGLLQLNWLAL